MEHFTCQSGVLEVTSSSRLRLTPYSNERSLHKRALFWRPWTRQQCGGKTDSFLADTKTSTKLAKKPSRVVHPVKLFWPKSRCFDYLYQEAEALLRNYPVQATICPYADSSSDEGEDSDEEDEKETN